MLNFRESDIKEDVLTLSQNKTKKKLLLSLQDDQEVKNELGKVIDRIIERKRSHKIRSLALVCNESGEPLSKYALRSRFDKARTQAKDKLEDKNQLDLAEAVRHFQFRDLRAKAGTDKADSAGDIRAAQKQLGHCSITMTEHYVRNRRGEKVKQTK